MLRQVGELASSKSAMNPSAPEFSALMTILRSVGPVISTQRCCSGRAPARPSSRPRGPSRSSGRKSSVSPGGQPRPALGARRQQLPAARSNSRAELGDELQRVGRQDSSNSRSDALQLEALRAAIVVILPAVARNGPA